VEIRLKNHGQKKILFRTLPGFEPEPLYTTHARARGFTRSAINDADSQLEDDFLWRRIH